MGSVAVLEGAARWRERDLSAMGNRFELKRRLLERRSRVHQVVAGTSRFNDGLDVAESDFNASVPSSSLAALEQTAVVALARSDVKRLVLELSPSQLVEQTDAPQTIDWPWFALTRQRRALRLEHFNRARALVNPDSFDGTEFFRSRWLTELRAEAERPMGTPEVVCPGPPSSVVSVYRRVAEAARAHQVEVMIVSPPVDSQLRPGECDAMRIAAREVADSARVPVFVFSCVAVDDAWFNDGLHLTAVGRAAFTASVARLAVAGACP